MANFPFFWIIPIVATIGGLSIPIIALLIDLRRRKLQHEERMAMIERGMVPPALSADDSVILSPEARREKSLRDGIICAAVGLGLGLAAWLLQNVVVHSFIPRGVVGPLSVAAAIVTFVGLGNLVHFAVMRRRGGGESRTD